MRDNVHREERPVWGEARTVRPDRWLGETECAVGPFMDRHVAERFAGLAVDFGQFGAYRQSVTLRGEHWYVEVTRPAGACR